MVGGERLAFVCGALCSVVGAALIVYQGQVEGGVWFGPAVLAGGLALLVMAFRSARRQRDARLDPTTAPSVARPGPWFPAALLTIVALQVVYHLWWTHFAGR
jgi:hypothetical protein